MSYIFLAAMVAHMVHCIVTNPHADPDKPKPPSAIGVVTQLPLLGLAIWYGIQLQVFSRDLVSPFYIAGGLAAGHVIFVLSLLITHRSVSDALEHSFDLNGLWNFGRDMPFVLSRFLSVAFTEELIYRVVAQTLLIEMTGNAFISILVVSVVFSIVHNHFFKNSLVISLEFLGFALLLGGLYHWTGSLVLVAVIHAVRDIEIAYIEFLVRAQELGDDEQAIKEFEALYLPRRPEKA